MKYLCSLLNVLGLGLIKKYYVKKESYNVVFWLSFFLYSALSFLYKTFASHVYGLYQRSLESFSKRLVLVLCLRVCLSPLFSFVLSWFVVCQFKTVFCDFNLKIRFKN